MPSHQTRKQVVRVPVKEFVTVAFAEDMDLAKDYKRLLAKEDIPVSIKNPHDSSSSSGIAVMVPEDHLDRAHYLIVSHNQYDDFYDTVFNSGELGLDDENLEEDLFDDDQY
jgi:hypothetical protein